MGMAAIEGRANRPLMGRTVIGMRFDRNCVLASVAAQLLVATVEGINVAAVVVGDIPLRVGVVAHAVEFGDDLVDQQPVYLMAAGLLGFGYAMGLGFDDIVEDNIYRHGMQRVRPTIDGAVVSGALKRIVRRLDRLSLPGKHRSLAWLTEYQS